MSHRPSKPEFDEYHKIIALLVIILLVMGFYFNKTIAEIRNNHHALQSCVDKR